MLSSLTLGQRIAAGFALVLVLLAFMAGFSLLELKSTEAGFSEYRSLARQSVLIGRVHASFLEMRLAVRDTIARRSDETARAYRASANTASTLLAQAKEQLTDSAHHGIVEEMAKEIRDHVTRFEQLAPLVGSSDPKAAERLREINQEMTALGDQLAANIEQFKLSLVTEQDRVGPQVQARIRANTRVTIFCGALAILLGIAASYGVTRAINRILNRIADTLAAGSEQTTAAASQVSASSQSLAEGSSQQAASLEETSASIEEMSSMTRRNAESARQARDVSNQTRSAADAGASDMAQMNVAMQAIKDSSGEIAKIVKTIDEIAFQTNILALNAAVEAARAGEAGAGFAVVAEEVRNLAQRSAQSAKETALKIEDSIAKSENGVRISGKVAASLEQIVAKARTMDSLVAEIATASNEQSEGVAQITLAISQMDKVTQANAGNAEETAAAAEELNAQATLQAESVAELARLVGRRRAAEASHSASAQSAAIPRPARRSPPRADSRANVAPREVSSTGSSSHNEHFLDS